MRVIIQFSWKQRLIQFFQKITIQESQSHLDLYNSVFSNLFGNLHLYNGQDPQIVCEAVEREPFSSRAQGHMLGALKRSCVELSLCEVGDVRACLRGRLESGFLGWLEGAVHFPFQFTNNR